MCNWSEARHKEEKEERKLLLKSRVGLKHQKRLGITTRQDRDEDDEEEESKFWKSERRKKHYSYSHLHLKNYWLLQSFLLFILARKRSVLK